MNNRMNLSSLEKQLNHSPLIKRYNQIRQEHNLLINEMFHDIILHPDQYEFILEKQNACNFPLDPINKAHAQLLAELMFYPHLKDGICVSQIYLEKHLLEEHRDLLISMLESKFSLFQLLERNITTGVVVLLDLVTKEKIEVVDKSLCIGNQQSFYYAGRVISYNGINFLTGLNYFFPVNSKTNKYMKKAIEEFNYKRSCDLVVKLYAYDQQNGLK